METFTSSITASVSKILGAEDISGAAVEDALKRRGSGADPEMITNEEIRVDDEFLQTYKVTSDAVHGGMGSVWRVRHMNWNVELAMKRPQPRYFAEGSAHKKEVFIRECENWINLGLHPGIVSCYYVREIGGVPSIFSEWMDNGSLKDRIGDGSLYQGIVDRKHCDLSRRHYIGGPDPEWSDAGDDEKRALCLMRTGVPGDLWGSLFTPPRLTGGTMEYIKNHRNQIYIGITAVALILALVLCCDYVIRRKAEQAEAAQTATTIKEKEKKDKAVITVNTKTIQDGLAKMGIMITQEYYFTQVETYTKDKNVLFVFPTTSGFTYSYDGSVLAGIDFGQVQIETDEDTQTITVDLPASEIQAVTIDRDTFKVYSEKDSLWNPLKLEDYNVSLVEFENSAKEKALENGILKRSDEQARTIVREFIGSLPNSSAYKVIFK